MAVVGKPNHAQAVTPSDTKDLLRPSTHLSFVDATGGPGVAAVFVDTVGGEKNVGINLPAGLWPISATRVYAASTTATLIVAYWDS